MGEAVVDSHSVLADPGTFEPVADGLKTRDPLRWPGYESGAATASQDESVAAGPARIAGHEVELAEFRFDHMGGSMGEVAGERLARGMERAAERSVPFVLRTSTGGARMQEGMISLAQMPKLVAARYRLSAGRVPFVALLGNPTTGGILASLGGLADITYAEAGATLAFTGPRVAEHLTGKAVDPASHTAEAALRNGMIDAVVAPAEASATIGRTLSILCPDTPRTVDRPAPVEAPKEEASDIVQRARGPERPTARSVIALLGGDGVDLRGDRTGRDESGALSAIGRIGGRRALFVASDRTVAPGPGAFRKIIRCIRIAERLGLPIVTLIDMPGADPSEGSEARGIAWSISETFDALLGATAPVLSVVTGEGGSGGAMALAAGDLLLACADSIFSVIAPEAAAAILWRDPGRGPEAARLLKPTAADLVELGIADALIPSPTRTEAFRSAVAYHLARLVDRPSSADLPEQRRRRWRTVG